MATITITDSAVIVTATDGSGNLSSWWQAIGSSDPWAQNLAASWQDVGSGGFSSPSIASTGDSAFIAAAAVDGNLYFWWQSEATGIWTKQNVGELSTPQQIGAYIYYSPAISIAFNSVVIAAQGNSDLFYWWQAFDTMPWNLQNVDFAPVNGTGYQFPSIAWTGSAVVIAALAAGGNVKYWWQGDESPLPWQRQSVSTQNQSGVSKDWPPSIVATDSSVVIVAADFNGDIYLWSQPFEEDGWAPQLVASGNYCYPSAVWTGTSLLITSADLNGNLYYFWETDKWNSFMFASGNYSSPSIAATSDSVVIAAIDQNANTLEYWWQGGDSTDWNQQTVASLA